MVEENVSFTQIFSARRFVEKKVEFSFFIIHTHTYTYTHNRSKFSDGNID